LFLEDALSKWIYFSLSQWLIFRVSSTDLYWLLRAFGKTLNISHATTTGLESAFKKQLNLTVPELIGNLRKAGVLGLVGP
jgi:hypothetical protein